MAMPADRILEAVVTPKKLTSHNECRRTKDAEFSGDAGFRHQRGFRLGAVR
jgi:hypothetical protein